MSRPRARASIAVCTCALLLACNDGTDYLAVNKRNRDGGGNDGSGGAADQRDAGGSGSSGGGRGGESGRSDGGDRPGARDAAADLDAASLMLPDGSVYLPDGGIRLPDGTVIDIETAIMRYGPEVDVSTCEVSDSDTWQTEVTISDEGGFALVPGALAGFGMAYRSTGDASCREGIGAMLIDSIDGFPEPHAVAPDCKAIRDVSLLSTMDGWLLAWVDNFTDSAELHTLALDSKLKPMPDYERTTLTDNDSLFERRPVLREVAGQPMIAWVTDDTEAGTQRISTQRLDGKTEAIEIVGAGAGQHPEGFAFAPVGAKAAAVGWVGPIESPGVWMHKLDADGAPVGGPIKLTDKVAASSSIDLAHREGGGAAVYSIEIDGLPQVRFRRLDEDAEPIGDERTLIGAPLRAQGASLHALGGGYAVVYRALAGGEIEQPEVRLTFVTKEGNLMRDPAGRVFSFHIGDATVTDARTYVSLSIDGELMIAWVDGGPADSNLLKLVRRRLDCN